MQLGLGPDLLVGLKAGLAMFGPVLSFNPNLLLGLQNGLKEKAQWALGLGPKKRQ